MRRLDFVKVSLIALLAFCAQQSARAELPPLIDRELLFGDPEISSALLSPDGQYIAFLKPFNGTRNIWVKRTSDPFDSARPLTADTKRPIPQFFWSRDGKYVLFVQDNAGDENYNVFALQPDAKPAAGKEVPDARNLTAAQGVRTALYSIPKTDPDVLYVGINDRDKAWHDLYKVRISTGERTLLRKNTERIAGWFFDLKGDLRLAMRTTDNGDTEILRVDADSFSKIYGCTVFETCMPARFHKDGKRTYLSSNQGTIDLTSLTLLDVATGKTEFLESDPEKRVDFGGAIFSESSDELLATVYLDQRVRLYWRDQTREAEYKFLKQRFGDKDIRTHSTTSDEQLALISAAADTEPGEVYLFNRATKELTFQYRARESIPRASLTAMQPIRYKSSDGMEIPAYLSLPKGVTAKGLPLVVVPHGGPWARDAWGYDTLAQFLTNRGFAVLQMNFRGSTGYGKKFLNAGNGEWGQKMQDDITWGVQHLVAQGTVDAKRVAIMGGSYGGYATLAGVSFTPDVYSAAVAIVAPSNLITLLNSIPPYWEAGRRQMYSRMADPNTPAGKSLLEKQSPLNSAAKIKTPLLVVQGANDPRVNKAESDQIVVALRERNFPVEYIVAPDEGHGFARPVNNMAMMAAAEKFLAKHISGVRHQPDMKPEVAERLKVITVDPKTVTKPNKLGAITVPTPSSDLTPITYNYAAWVDRGGQKIELKSSTTVTDNGATWRVVEKSTSPMGEATDDALYTKKSLQVTERTMTQGPAVIHYTVAGGKAQGDMKMSGQSRPIAVELGGATFGDGPGAGNIFATLPLADGYTATFNSFNFLSQQVAPVQLRVTSEKIASATGNCDCFKVELELANSGKTVLWIAKSPRRFIKSTVTGPQLGGATMTTELLP